MSKKTIKSFLNEISSPREANLASLCIYIILLFLFLIVFLVDSDVNSVPDVFLEEKKRYCFWFYKINLNPRINVQAQGLPRAPI